MFWKKKKKPVFIIKKDTQTRMIEKDKYFVIETNDPMSVFATNIKI
jgi:hypothetical protein